MVTQLSQSHAGGLGLVIGLLGGLWFASGYIGAFGRAMNRMYEIDDGRPFYKLRPVMLAVTLIAVILVALVAVAVAVALVAVALVVSGPVARAVGNAIGAGSSAVTAWNIVKWPVILVVVFLLWLWITNLELLFGAEFDSETERARQLQ